MRVTTETKPLWFVLLFFFLSFFSFFRLPTCRATYLCPSLFLLFCFSLSLKSSTPESPKTPSSPWDLEWMMAQLTPFYTPPSQKDTDATFIVKNLCRGALCSEKKEPLEWTAATYFRTRLLLYTWGGSVPLLLSHFPHIWVTTWHVHCCEEREVRFGQEVLSSNAVVVEKRRITPILTIHLFLNHMLKTKKEQSDEKINKKERRRKKRPSRSCPALVHRHHTIRGPHQPPLWSLWKEDADGFLSTSISNQSCKVMPLFRGKDL